MKPFDLEAAKRGEPIVTRDGREAKFIAYVPEMIDESRLLYVVMGRLCRGSKYGKYLTNSDFDSAFDLFMAPKKRAAWLVINGTGSAKLFNTLEMANLAYPELSPYYVEIEE